jgi:hypothetical protein
MIDAIKTDIRARGSSKRVFFVSGGAISWLQLCADASAKIAHGVS